MKEAQKKFLGAALAVSSIAGIVAPSVTAMATVVDDEQNATPDQLRAVINEYSVKLEKNPIFANYHRVKYAAERLVQYDEQYANDTINSIAKYDNQVYTKDIVKLVDKMNEFSMSKNMEIYDELINEDIPAFAKNDKESADYLLDRLDVWGKAIVFEVDKNYSKATDEIVKVNTLREKDKLEEALDQVDVAKKAIKNIITYDINGKYLEGKLKIEEDKVRHDIQERDLYVRKVTANNGREIEVTFNKSVSKSSAEDIDNYSFKSANSSAKDIEIEEAELQDDDCTVILKIKKGINTNSDAKHMVSIQDVVTNDGTEMQDYYEILNIYDNVAPEVKSVKYIDDNRIRVNFTEPVNISEDDLSACVKIRRDGAKVNISNKAFKLDDDDQLYFEIDLSKANIDRNNKEYTLEVDGMSDYAGNALVKYNDDLTVKKDDEDPYVKEIKGLASDAFRVKFNEKILNDKFKVKVDGEELKLTKGDNLEVVDEDDDDVVESEYNIKLPKGSTEGNKLVTIYDYQDLYENDGDPVTEEICFESQHPVLEDTTPELKTTSKGRYQVFTFDRDVWVGKNKDNLVEVKHVDSDGVTITTKDVPLVDEKYNDTDKDLDLESYEIALDITKLDEGEYTFDLETKNVIDHYDQKVEKISLKFDNNTKDKTGKVRKVIPNDPKEQKKLDEDLRETDTDKALNKVIVEFDKELGEDAKDPDKYTIDNRYVFDKAVFVNDKKHVELTLKKDAISKTGNKTFRVEGIKNIKDYDEKLEFKDNTKPEVSRAEIVGLNTIKLIMSEDIKKDATINENDIKVRVEDNTLKKSIKVTGQGTDVLIITLDDEDKLRSSKDKVTLEILDDNRISDEAGNCVESGMIEDVEVNLDDMLVTAINKVEELKTACSKDLSESDNLKKAQDAKDIAQKAVDKLKSSPDKTNLQNDIDEQSENINLQDAKNKVATLKEACEKDLTVEANLKDAKAAYESAEKAIDLLNSDDKKVFETDLKDAKTKIDGQDTNNKAKTEAIEKINTKTDEATVEDFKAAGITDVTDANLKEVKVTIGEDKKANGEKALDATAIQKDVNDTNAVKKEAARYITTAKINKDAKIDTDIDSIIVKLNDGKATDGIILTRNGIETPGYIKLDGDKFKLNKLNTGDEVTEKVSFNLKQGYAESKVEVTVTIEKSAETPTPAPTPGQ